MKKGLLLLGEECLRGGVVWVESERLRVDVGEWRGEEKGVECDKGECNGRSVMGDREGRWGKGCLHSVFL